MTQLTYPGGQEQKDERVTNVKKHRELDMLEAGTYGYFSEHNQKWVGCSVGCEYRDLRPNDYSYRNGETIHAYLSKVYGYPIVFELLRDGLFESLSCIQDKHKEAANFHVNFVSAIPVGVNLDLAVPIFCKKVLNYFEALYSPDSWDFYPEYFDDYLKERWGDRYKYTISYDPIEILDLLETYCEHMDIELDYEDIAELLIKSFKEVGEP